MKTKKTEQKDDDKPKGKVGDIVKIYQDVVTGERFESTATLIEFIKPINETCERWRVHLDNDPDYITAIRTVNPERDRVGV